MTLYDVPADSRAIIRTAGGGGWGDPLERDIERVLRDVREGLVTLEAAERDYGVVIDPQSGIVDAQATARTRRPPDAPNASLTAHDR